MAKPLNILTDSPGGLLKRPADGSFSPRQLHQAVKCAVQ
jgi:hypothetical protein